jgi:hypothetical protein
MATLLRPPPTVKTKQSNRPYFTLHKYVNTVMAWETPDTKMAVVAFKRRADIHKLGSMIEYHRKATHEWPDFREMTFTTGPVHGKPLEILDIYEWSDVDELKEFCALRYFDLILVDTLSESFNIRGEVYSLEIPLENHVPYLENLLNENEAY